MKEMQNIVNAEVKKMSESGEIQKQIEDGVKSAISKAIESQFQSYGNITKQLENIFKENLKIAARDLDIPSINSTMTGVVNSSINEFYKGQAADKLHSLMESKLKPLPDKMDISEFLEQIAGIWYTEEYDSFDDVDDYMTVDVDDHLSHWGIITLKVSKKKAVAFSSGDYLHICFSKNKTEETWTLQGRHGSSSPYYMFDVDALIFKAYAQRVTFTNVDNFNEDDLDLSLKPC